MKTLEIEVSDVVDSLNAIIIVSLIISVLSILVVWLTWDSSQKILAKDKEYISCVNTGIGTKPIKEVKEMCEWKVRGQ